MLAPPNLGSDYGAKFNSIFPDLAKQYGALLYPFFLTGVVGDETLNQRDGLHPTAKGVDVIVAKNHAVGRTTHRARQNASAVPDPVKHDAPAVHCTSKFPPASAMNSPCCAAVCRVPAGSIPKITT